MIFKSISRIWKCFCDFWLMLKIIYSEKCRVINQGSNPRMLWTTLERLRVHRAYHCADHRHLSDCSWESLIKSCCVRQLLNVSYFLSRASGLVVSSTNSQSFKCCSQHAWVRTSVDYSTFFWIYYFRHQPKSQKHFQIMDFERLRLRVCKRLICERNVALDRPEISQLNIYIVTNYSSRVGDRHLNDC